MAIQLASNPIIKINGEELKGFRCLGFTLTKRLLEPNRFDFVFRKEDMSLTQDDIKFELREQLLGALVECSVSAYHYDLEGDCQVCEVSDFFRGYIHHVKLERSGNKSAVAVRCTAFSVDVRFKGAPRCDSYLSNTLKNIVEEMITFYSDTVGPYNTGKKDYDDRQPIWDLVKVNISEDFEDFFVPYTVQYDESDYDFLKRLAKRYGQYFYHENGKVVFGDMVELETLNLRSGVDLEQYDYNLNMNGNLGIALCEHDYLADMDFIGGSDFAPQTTWKHNLVSMHEMSKSAYNHASQYFNRCDDRVFSARSARIVDEDNSKNIGEQMSGSDPQNVDTSDNLFETREMRAVLEKYLVADTVLCHGVARRIDLRLGSIVVIEDETNTEDNSDIIEHEPLKVIDLTYRWEEGENLRMTNEFQAVPQKAPMPPYLERDQDGFLTYGDFDIFPHCGPQHGIVYDNKDPMHLGRVRVVLGWQDVAEKVGMPHFEGGVRATPWIRVAHAYAGFERGCHLVPEIDDEVIVGFEENNAERPYVLASVHNPFTCPPVKNYTDEKVAENNEYKTFRTRNGHTIEIRDKKKHGYIKIFDEVTHNYVLTLDADRALIRLESAGNIELEAKEDIVMHAGNDIKVTAENRMYLEAVEDYIDITAKKSGIYMLSKANRTDADEIKRSATKTIEDEAEKGVEILSRHELLTIFGNGSTIHVDQNDVAIHEQGHNHRIGMDMMGIVLSSSESLLFSAKNRSQFTCKASLTIKSDQLLDLGGGNLTNITGTMVKIN